MKDEDIEEEDEDDDDEEDEDNDEDDDDEIKCENCGKVFSDDEEPYGCDECGSELICEDCIVLDLENASICKECIDKAYPRKVETKVVEKIVYKDVAIKTGDGTGTFSVNPKFDPDEKTEFD